ncbi:hypothetical protein [Gemmobacter sp.]|nr:hypothetical protein [Gemmobacter sp.]
MVYDHKGLEKAKSAPFGAPLISVFLLTRFGALQAANQARKADQA